MPHKFGNVVSTNDTFAPTSFQPNLICTQSFSSGKSQSSSRAFTTATPTPTASARLSCCCRNPFATDSNSAVIKNFHCYVSDPTSHHPSPLPLRPYHPLATPAAVITHNEPMLGILDPYTITTAKSVFPDKDICRPGLLHRVFSNGALRTIRENETMMKNKREQDMRNGS